MTQENGFKETEIGLIPSGWEVSLLSDDTVADLIMGQSPPSDTYNQTGDGVPFMQGKAEFGRVFPNPDKWCTAPSRLAEKNDILMSVRAPVGDVNIAPFKCAIGRGLAAIRAKDKTMPLYLFFYLTFAKKRLEDKGTGSIFKAINKGVLENFKIALPEVGEQKNIVATLFQVLQTIQHQEKIIEKTKELKKSLMQKLFTEGLRGDELKETVIGTVPITWNKKDLEQVADIVYGAQAAVAHALDSSIGTPIFTNINITNEGQIDLTTLRYYKVPEKKRDRLMLKKGDILFNWRSGSKEHVGKTALFELDGEYTFSSFILRFALPPK